MSIKSNRLDYKIFPTYNEKLVFNIDVKLRISDGFAVRSLNRMLRKDTAAPIGATSHNLGFDSSLDSEILRSNVAQGMVDISSDGMFWSLDPNKILILPFSSGHN